MQTVLFWLDQAKWVLIVGPVMAAVCALLSVFIVLRRMAMISEAIAHAGLGGLALALLVGYWWAFAETYWGQQLITGGFCVGTALMIGLFSRGRDVSEDSAIGIFLVASVSLGIIMLFIRRALPGINAMPTDLESVLFGNINSVDATDAWTMGVVAALVFAVVLLILPSLIYTTMDEEMARISGVRTWLVHLLLLVMVSVVISTAARMVGMLMINALMILPGATARLVSRRFSRVLVVSLVVGVGGVTLSLLGTIGIAMAEMELPGRKSIVLHAFSSVPSGPLIVLSLFLIFLATWLTRGFFRRRNRERPPAPPRPLPAGSSTNVHA